MGLDTTTGTPLLLVEVAVFHLAGQVITGGPFGLWVQPDAPWEQVRRDAWKPAGHSYSGGLLCSLLRRDDEAEWDLCGFVAARSLGSEQCPVDDPEYVCCPFRGPRLPVGPRWQAGRVRCGVSEGDRHGQESAEQVAQVGHQPPERRPGGGVRHHDDLITTEGGQHQPYSRSQSDPDSMADGADLVNTTGGNGQ